MRIAFVGHFSPLHGVDSGAGSAAGNQVQREILNELIGRGESAEVHCYSMPPHSAWPRGPLFVRSAKEPAIDHIGYINIPVLKHLSFSLRLGLRLLTKQPAAIIQYNSYVFENLALIAARTVRRSRLGAIVQDVLIDASARPFTRRWLKGLPQQFSLGIVRRAFDVVVPITQAIADDFGFAPSRTVVFQGGMTDFAKRMACTPGDGLTENFAVFAGALEPYNGIDRLIDRWLEPDITPALHVFGRGSHEPVVKRAAASSDKIVFHGMQPETVVFGWQERAAWNFCLRYSVNLNQAYFFPSKLFNVMGARGATIVNPFQNIPPDLLPHLSVASEDLADLATRLESSRALSAPLEVQRRRDTLQVRHSWRWCVEEIVARLFRGNSAVAP